MTEPLPPEQPAPVDRRPSSRRPDRSLHPSLAAAVARNLLIDPVKVLGQFAFPAVIALVGLSSGDRGMPWWALPIVVVGAVAFGVLPGSPPSTGPPTPSSRSAAGC